MLGGTVEPLASAVSRPCILVCRVCGDDLVYPFDSYGQRGRWAAEHTAGTGHKRWYVHDGWPTPEQAAQLIATHDAEAQALAQYLDALAAAKLPTTPETSSS